MNKDIVKKVVKAVAVVGFTYMVGFVAGSIRTMKYLCESKKALEEARELLKETEEIIEATNDSCCCCCECSKKESEKEENT